MNQEHPVGPNAIDIDQVSKRYGVVQALDRIDLHVPSGQVLGLVGQNGAGKSTLVNILCGVVTPDDGTVAIRGNPAPLGHPRQMADAGVAVVSQEQSLIEQLSVWENIYLGDEISDGRTHLLRRTEMKDNAEALLARLQIHGIRPTAPLSELSFAERQLVEIARAIHRTEGKAEPVLVLDEPTSGLSPRETEILFRMIETASSGATFLFVSHVLPDTLRLCSRVVVFTNGRLVADRQSATVTEEDLHELMVGRARGTDYYAIGRQQLPPGPVLDENIVLEMVGGTQGSRFAEIDLKVGRGEILGLAGVVGSGTSEVTAALAGALHLDAGTVRVLGKTVPGWSVRHAVERGIRYVPPERRRDALFPYSTVAGNILISYLPEVQRPRVPWLDAQKQADLVGRLIDRVSLKPADPRRPVGELSGGNQQKVVFARLLGNECLVAILDNPTRGVDVGTREEIYVMIRDLATAGTGIVITSESIEELIGLCDRLVVLRAGRAVAEIPCPPTDKPTPVAVLRHM